MSAGNPNTEKLSTSDEVLSEIFLSVGFDGIINRLLNSFFIWRKPSKELRNAARHYSNELRKRYGNIRIFAMSEQVALDDIFVRVNILEKITNRFRATTEELEKAYDRDKRLISKNIETITSEIAINKYEHFIVLGKPGAGKTTFLKHLISQFLKTEASIQKRRVPIFISLKDFSETNIKLFSYIKNEFNNLSGTRANSNLIDKLLAAGKCLLLLDGLDEVSPENQDKVLKEVIKLSTNLSRNQIVITCRVAAYNHWFDKFTDVEIADFNSEQISKFIQNWFIKEPKVADNCISQILSSPQLREIASTPLLLALLCVNYDEYQNFPLNRAELYKEAIDALLKKWDASRRINRGEIYKLLSLKQKESMLSKIAFDTFKNGNYFIHSKILERQIASFISNIPGVNEENLSIDSEAVLKEIESQHGIFAERAAGIYSFSHLTFQEYFTAKYVVDNIYNNTLNELVEHLDEIHWREVFLLAAGMMNESLVLLDLMRKKTFKFIEKHDEILKILNILDNASEKNENNDWTGKLSALCYYISIIEHVLDGKETDIDLKSLMLPFYEKNDEDALIKNLDYLITKTKILNKSITNSSERVNDLAKAITISGALGQEDSKRLSLSLACDRIAEKLRNLAVKDTAFSLLLTNHNIKTDYDKSITRDFFSILLKNGPQTLIQYLTSLLLIVQCINTSSYISKEARKAYIGNLLDVPSS